MKPVRYLAYFVIVVVLVIGVLFAMPPQSSKYNFYFRALFSGQGDVLEVDFGQYGDILYSLLDSRVQIPNGYSGIWKSWDDELRCRWQADLKSGEIQRVVSSFGKPFEMSFVNGKPHEGTMFVGIKSDQHIIYSVKAEYKNGSLIRLYENELRPEDCRPIEGEFRSVKSGDLYKFVDGRPVPVQN